MNSNLPNSQNAKAAPGQKKPEISHHSSGGKEVEGKAISSGEALQTAPAEVEIPKEVEKAGVQKISESIELPPDIKNLGISNTPSPPAVIQIDDLPKVELPISDQQVLTGLHQDITSALKWLAVWCIHKLHKAHIILKVVHGKIKRVRE